MRKTFFAVLQKTSFDDIINRVIQEVKDMKNFGSQGLLASFWEELTGDSNGYTLMVLIGLGIAALVVIVVSLVLLARRSHILLDKGDGKTEKINLARHGAAKLPVPERDGYVFCGWFTDRALTKKAESPFRVPVREITLFAKWEKASDEQSQPEEQISAQAPFVAEESAVLQALAGENTVPQPEPQEPAGEVFAEEAEEESEEEPKDGKEIEAAPLPDSIAGTPDEITETPAEIAAEDAAESAAQYTTNEAVLAEDAEAEQEEEEDVNEAGEGDEIDNALVTLVSGAKVFVQYRRSFRARLIQADDEMKAYYNDLRNEILSFIGVKERVSWNYDSFNVGRKQFVKVNANRKSLILYLALDPEAVDEKYTFRDVSEKKRYANVPVRYKITGSRSFKYALELLEQTAAKFELDSAHFEEKLDIPYEEREALIKKRLIKVYAKRETGETVTEEELEKYIEEGATVESLSAYTVTDHISVNEAEVLISDATAKQLVALAEVRGGSRAGRGKRSYVNLDTVCANYREGEKVDLDSLKAKGLIDKKAAAYKVLARGSLDKSLTVEANDFSLPAVKMIALTGGKVIKVR